LTQGIAQPETIERQLHSLKSLVVIGRQVRRGGVFMHGNILTRLALS
jgi:hypothetical protein